MLNRWQMPCPLLSASMIGKLEPYELSRSKYIEKQFLDRNHSNIFDRHECSMIVTVTITNPDPYSLSGSKYIQTQLIDQNLKNAYDRYEYNMIMTLFEVLYKVISSGEHVTIDFSEINYFKYHYQNKNKDYPVHMLHYGPLLDENNYFKEISKTKAWIRVRETSEIEKNELFISIF